MRKGRHRKSVPTRPSNPAERARSIIAEGAALAERRALRREHDVVAPLLQAGDHEALAALGWHRITPEGE